MCFAGMTRNKLRTTVERGHIACFGYILCSIALIIEWPITYQTLFQASRRRTTSFLKNDLKVVDELIGIGSACPPTEGDPCIFNRREVRNIDCIMY